MKAKRLSEIRETIASAEFQSWWEEIKTGRAARADSRERYDELLTQAMLMDFRSELAQKNGIDTLYRASECEDQAASDMAEAQDDENKSFRVVAEYEEHRYHVSELWYRLGAAEKSADEAKDGVHALKARLQAATGPASREIAAELKRAEADLKEAQRTHRHYVAEYEREHARQLRFWSEVEKLWAQSAEKSLRVAEKRSQGKKIRRQAEVLFQVAEDRKAKVRQLREEAEAVSRVRESADVRLQDLLKRSHEQFDCSAGEEFLYWRHRDNQRLAFCVPLLDDNASYNIEVRALSVYAVDRQRGVGFLEPAVDARTSAEEGDSRFEEYFLRGRKGRARSEVQDAT